MSNIVGLLAFLPTEFIPLLVAFAGLALIIGARKVASTILLVIAIMVVAPLLLEPLLMFVPDALMPLMIFIVILLTIAFVMQLLIGRDSWNETKGILAADVIRFIVLLPFRFFGLLFRTFFRRG